MTFFSRISLSFFAFSSFAFSLEPWRCTFWWNNSCHDIEVAIEYNSQVIFDNFNYSVPEIDVALYVYRNESLSSYGISDSWAASHLVDASSVLLLVDSSNVVRHNVFKNNAESYDVPNQIKSGKVNDLRLRREHFIRRGSLSRQSKSVLE